MSPPLDCFARNDEFQAKRRQRSIRFFLQLVTRAEEILIMVDKVRLPLVKAKSSSLNMPDAVAIGKAFSIATTLESAEYLYERFSKAAADAGVIDKFQGVLDEIAKYVDLIRAQDPKGSEYWSGDLKATLLTKFRIYQDSLSKEAVSSLLEKVDKAQIQIIDFDFAMSDNSELLQGYSINGEPIDDEMNEQINIIYSDWLTKNQMICRDGVIYASDENGDTLERNGVTVRVTPEQYKKMFMNKTDGFSTFVKNKTDRKLDISPREQEFPVQRSQV